MPKVHIAGYDGTPESRAAVELAAVLGAPVGARVIAVTAYEPPAPSIGLGASIASDALLVEQSRHAAAAVLADLHVPGVERETQIGMPAPALCAVAERERADLIVVGATHRGTLGRIAPGSLAERLVHGAPCAVAVAPTERHASPIRTVAVAYDGGPESTAALTEAQLIAGAHGAALRVLAVCETPNLTVDLPAMHLENPMRARLTADVERIVAELPAALNPAGEVLTGPPGPTLAMACENGVDLLVAGSRSYGPLRGALVGSVSRHLVDHAPCPVLIIPRGVGAAAAAQRTAASGEAITTS